MAEWKVGLVGGCLVAEIKSLTGGEMSGEKFDWRWAQSFRGGPNETLDTFTDPFLYIFRACANSGYQPTILQRVWPGD